MQLHNLKPIHKKKKRKRIGRGGKRGTYCGRGIKGQKSRAGKKQRVGLAGGNVPLKKIPKKRGAGMKSKKRKGGKIKRGVKLARIKKLKRPVIVNIKDIDKKFESGETVSPLTLIEKGLIDKIGNKIPSVKILGKGDTKKKLNIKDCYVSKSAKEKIEKAGGKVQ